MHRPTQSDAEGAVQRRAAFVAAIPQDLLSAEDRLPAKVTTLNGSSRSKLSVVYKVADELSRVREPFVACKSGCSSCCNMNVSITRAEADRMARAVGRSAAALSASPRHAPDKFSGVPCPFLTKKGTCSVYADRPLACRKHSSFFMNETPCHPSVMHLIEVPMVSFSGLDAALMVASGAVGPLLADIRDFFPSVARF
jgi:Fe-S-cluster containining protein